MIKRLTYPAVLFLISLVLFTGCTVRRDGINSGMKTTRIDEQREVRIKYASWMSKGEDMPILEAFMKANAGIIVENEVIDGKQYDRTMKTRILSGDAPDIYLLPFANYTKYATEGYLMDLTNEQGMDLLAKNPLADQALKIHGKRFGFMINAGTPINPIYYNKKSFAKLNITPPKNAEEFLEVCEKIKADHVDPLVFGAKDAWTLSGTLYTAIFRSYALPRTDNDIFYALATGKVMPSQVMDYPFRFIEDLNNKGYISKASLTLTYDQSVQYFADGKAAMLPQGTWVPALEHIKNAKNFELGAFMPPIPDVDGKKYAMTSGDRVLVVSSKTKKGNEAKKLFNFFVEPANLKAYLEAQSLFTVLKGIDYKTDPSIQDYVNSFTSKDFIVVIGSKSALTAAFSKEVDNALQNILAGSEADKELTRLDGEFEKTKDQMAVKD